MHWEPIALTSSFCDSFIACLKRCCACCVTQFLCSIICPKFKWTENDAPKEDSDHDRARTYGDIFDKMRSWPNENPDVLEVECRGCSELYVFTDKIVVVHSVRSPSLEY